MESGSDDSGSDLSDTEQVHILLELQHKRKRVWRKRVKRNPRVRNHHPFLVTHMQTRNVLGQVNFYIIGHSLTMLIAILTDNIILTFFAISNQILVSDLFFPDILPL